MGVSGETKRIQADGQIVRQRAQTPHLRAMMDPYSINAKMLNLDGCVERKQRGKRVTCLEDRELMSL